MGSLEGGGSDEARLEDLLDNVDDLAALATLEGKILYVNRAFREKLGYAEHEIEGLDSYRVVHPMHEEDVRAANEKLMAGEPLHNIERILVAKDGRQIHVEGSISCRFKDGKPWYVRAVWHDITRRKEAERLKDELIAIANHEMRNPLSVVQTSLELMKEEMNGASERHRKMLELALHNAHRLLDLVNAYLDLARIESGGAPFRAAPMELMPMVERVIDANRPLALKAEVGLELSESLPGARLEADEARLVQVLTNFLSNAVKFSPPGRTVRVSARRSGDRLRVSVADEGPGIPPAFRGRIFAKFAQAEGHNRGGSGLGLAISKTIMEKLGGAVGFESEAGKGTTFYFELPELRA